MLNFAEQTGSGAVMIVWSFLLRGGTIKVYEAVRARVPQKHQSDTLTQHTTANLPTQLNNKQTNKQTNNKKATTKQPQSNKKNTKNYIVVVVLTSNRYIACNYNQVPIQSKSHQHSINQPIQ